MTEVVIVGAGFGGLEAAKALADAPASVNVTVIDKRNHHTFQPLLYQVATAGLNPSDIAQPIRQIIGRQPNCRVLMAEVTDVDPANRTLATTLGPIDFDYLIVATGATHAYFGNDDWERLAPGLKTVEDALDIRHRILLAFERAEASTDPSEQKRHMTFVVVGGGPTGVELAGAIREIATHTLRGQYRSIDTTESRVVLLEAGPRVLPTFAEKLSTAAADQLRSLGVDVFTSRAVTGIDDRGVDTGEGRIEASTVLWAAGVAASPLGRALSQASGVELDRSGRVKVGPSLTVPGFDNVFVIGDLAAATDAAGVTVPGVAPGAQQGGKHAVACIEADLDNRPRPEFVYFDKGSMATVGRSRAVVEIRRLRFSGFPAWVTWWLVHIWSLVGFRSRATVMAGWAWQYLTRRRDARLITNTPPLDP
ncbi:MAG: NAD(P)/FAD-dependent oxidoreductase [Acidimicrobiia bacterium]|nr:NAD(P)/FAD-dependent oxidoreductase [Acidimicrobiia bacterium]